MLEILESPKHLVAFKLSDRLTADDVAKAYKATEDAIKSNDVAVNRDLAEEFHLPVTQVTNHLAWARRELRRLLLERLHSLSASDAEFRDEAASVLGQEVE